MGVLGRITGSSFVIFISFVLATALLVLMGLKAPDQLKQVLDMASWVENQLTHLGLPNEYNNWMRLFIDDSQLTMIFFVVIIRGLLAIIGSGFSRMVNGPDYD